MRSLSRVVWLRNAGLAQLRVCGSEPIFTLFVSAAVLDDGAIRWSRSPGPRPWTRAPAKRTSSATSCGGARSAKTSWGDPYLSVPAGSSIYAHIDRNVELGESYEYSVAAQDCTPTLSPAVTVGPVGPIALP